MTPRVAIKTTPAFQIVQEEGIRIYHSNEEGGVYRPLCLGPNGALHFHSSIRSYRGLNSFYDCLYAMSMGRPPKH